LVAVMMAARGFLPKYQKPVKVDRLEVGFKKYAVSDFMALIKAGKANAYTVASDDTTIHTPLGFAVHFNIEAIPLLLAKGANPFWRPEDSGLAGSDDAFSYAFRYIDAFRALLNGHTSFIHKKDDKHGQTLLHRAVFRADYRPFLDDLLQRGARVNEVDNDGLTPLGLIASNQGARIDYEYFITQLCEHGADMHKKTKSSNGTEVESPLILSIEYHNVPILELFLKRLLADGQLDEHKKSLTKARKTHGLGDVAMVQLFVKYKIPLN
jgi:ankyrin repeat protein